MSPSINLAKNSRSVNRWECRLLSSIETDKVHFCLRLACVVLLFSVACVQMDAVSLLSVISGCLFGKSGLISTNISSDSNHRQLSCSQHSLWQCGYRMVVRALWKRCDGTIVLWQCEYRVVVGWLWKHCRNIVTELCYCVVAVWIYSGCEMVVGTLW